MWSDKELRTILRKVEKWYDEFTESEFFKDLSDQQKEYSADIIMSVTEYMYNYYLADPSKWRRSDLEDCLLNILPAKFTAEITFFEAIVPVLIAFIKFLSKKGRIRGAQTLITTIKRIRREIIKNAKNPFKWGIAKSLVMVGIAFGMNILDKKEVQKIQTLYNILNMKFLP